MTDKNVHRTEAIKWDQYLNYELATADSTLIGFVTGVTDDSEHGATYLSIEGAGRYEKELQVPVTAIGVITGHSLVLDVAAEGIEFFEKVEFSPLENLPEPEDDGARATFQNGTGPLRHHPESPPDYHAPRHPGLNQFVQQSYPGGTQQAGYSPVVTAPRTGRSTQLSLEPRAIEPPQWNDPRHSVHETMPAGVISSTRRRTGRARGRLEIEVTQVRPHEQLYEEPVLHALNRRTFVLEQLVLDMYMQHTRFDEPAISPGMFQMPPNGSEVPDSARNDMESLAEGYDQFTERSLAELDVVYLFAGSVYASLRRHAGLTHDFLATWAICSDGKQALIHLTSGDDESRDDWAAHFRSLLDRDLGSPVTITTGGTPGLIQAVRESFPDVQRVRCWAEKLSEILDEAPATIRPGLRLWLQSIRDAPDYVYGEEQALNILEKFDANYPDAMRVFADDLHASLVHLSLPVTHRRAVRAATISEQNVLDEWNRTPMLQNLRGERDGLAAVFGILWRSSRWWQRLRFTSSERDQLDELQRTPAEPAASS